jgi:hypothetical protein
VRREGGGGRGRKEGGLRYLRKERRNKRRGERREKGRVGRRKNNISTTFQPAKLS